MTLALRALPPPVTNLCNFSEQIPYTEFHSFRSTTVDESQVPNSPTLLILSGLRATRSKFAAGHYETPRNGQGFLPGNAARGDNTRMSKNLARTNNLQKETLRHRTGALAGLMRDV